LPIAVAVVLAPLSLAMYNTSVNCGVDLKTAKTSLSGTSYSCECHLQCRMFYCGKLGLQIDGIFGYMIFHRQRIDKVCIIKLMLHADNTQFQNKQKLNNL